MEPPAGVISLQGTVRNEKTVAEEGSLGAAVFKEWKESERVNSYPSQGCWGLSEITHWPGSSNMARQGPMSSTFHGPWPIRSGWATDGSLVFWASRCAGDSS